MDEDILLINKEFSENVLKKSNYKLHLVDLKSYEFTDSKAARNIKIEYEICYEKLYVGQWNQISSDVKYLFTILSFLYSSTTIQLNDTARILENDQILKSLKIADIAIIYDVECQSPATKYLKSFAEILHKFIVQQQKNNRHPDESNKLFLCPVTENSQAATCDIPSLNQPTEDFFFTNFYNFHQPVKILDCMKSWEALMKWNEVDYLLNICGYRTVPIELGKKYDNDDWSQGLYHFGEFVKDSILSSDNPTKAYLAQHNLFDQITDLRKDFEIPKFCHPDLNEESDDPLIKAWIGPNNTISTMHTDDKHNIFCQVVGEKLFILAAPEDSENLYTYDGLLNNTCRIDPENLDTEEFPKAKNAKFYKVVMKPGEILYIPKLWFHYVRSLTNSISVSFWFDS